MRHVIPKAGETVDSDYVRQLDQIDRMADMLDTRFRIPFTRQRVGWDPIIGIIPIAGDIAMAILAGRIVLTARNLGADATLQRRMWLNVIVDTALGAVPIIGPIFDLFYRANARNVMLLMSAIHQSRTAPPA